MFSRRFLEGKTLIFQIQLWPPWTHCALDTITGIFKIAAFVELTPGGVKLSILPLYEILK
jgi:hypothetical protein